VLAVALLPAYLGGLLAGLMLATRVLVAVARRNGARRLLPSAAARARDNGGLLLGHDPDGRRVILHDHQLSAHGLILGASGAGKSTTMLAILIAQIQRGSPVIALDLKGSPAFARELRDAATAAGRRFRGWTPDGAERWNPLATGNATQLKDKLIATERFTEPHFQRAAERHLQLTLRALIAAGRTPSLPLVTRLLDPRHLGALVRTLPPPEAASMREYLASLTPDQLSAIRGLASRLAIITESHTGAYLTDPSGAGIDLRRGLAGDEVILFSLNSSSYGKLAAQLGTLVLQDLIAAAGDRLEAGRTGRGIVAIDEFSALGGDNLMALLARGREAGVSVLLATQELADLDRAARGLRDQVLGNTALKIAHRQDVPASAHAVASMAGTIRWWERSYALRRGPFGTLRPGGETYRLTERHIVDPEAVRTLRTGDAVVITKLPAAATRRVRVRPAAGREQER
jgi:hypothetical protein